MRITSAGNIGIGTASPDNVLTIQGDTNIASGYGLVIGHGSQITTDQANEFQILGTGSASSRATIGRWSADAAVATIQFLKSRNATIGSNTIVQDGDNLGQIAFHGDDGADYATPGADILVTVDGTPGANDMPAKMAFRTTADGASSPTTRMVIDSSGAVTKPTTPAFLANNSVQTLNVTGDGTLYNLCFANERFDQGGDWDGLKVFTAPVTGKYYLSLQTDAVAVNTAMCVGTITIVTSNQSYQRQYNPSNPNGISYTQASLVVTADMDAGDIACVTVYIGGSTKTAGFGGNTGFGLFGGALIA